MSYYRETRNRMTGTTIVTGRGDDYRIDLSVDGDGPWFNICADHGAIISHTTLALARYFAPAPDNWCDDCRDLLEGKP
jgi:hypothetical protein